MTITTFADIFKYDASVKPISVEEEVALIVRAQSGDEDAVLALIRQYGPLLRSNVARTAKVMNRDDAEGAALLAFMEALREHDVNDPRYKTGSLSSTLRPKVFRALAEARAEENSRIALVPRTTFERYLAVMDAAGGDPDEGAQIAPSHDLASKTFASIFAMVHDSPHVTTTETEDSDGEDFLGRARPVRGEQRDDFEAAEDAVLADIALDSLDDQERDVVEFSYGFRETDDFAWNEPMPDGAVADVVGLSRQKVQRTRRAAIKTMRVALLGEDD